MVPELTPSSPPTQKANQKKKKKKKRRHSEVEGDAVVDACPATVTQPDLVDDASEEKRKKKKKKRKKENDDGEKVKERECVPSHLDTSNQEEDWCPGGMWSLSSRPGTEQSKQKSHVAATTPTPCESNKKEHRKESVLLKKKKKKKKKMMQVVEALQDPNPACPAPEWWVGIFRNKLHVCVFTCKRILFLFIK